MKIAFIAPFGLQPKTTVSARMLPLAHALARRGHMVRVVIPPWDDPGASSRGESNIASLRRAEDGRLSGVHVVVLPLSERLPKSIALTGGLVRAALRPTGHADTSFESREYSEAVRTLTTFRADVVHIFKPIGYSGLAGLALQALRLPWVLDTDDWEGPGGWADVNPYSLPQKAAVTLLEATLPRMAGAVTAASHTLQGRAWGFGLPRSRVFYMPNGIWHEKYAAWIQPIGEATIEALRRKHSLQGGPVILLYTRFAEFPWRWPLEVLRCILKEHPRAKLLVVGGGFFGEENKLKAEAARLGLQDRVVTTGMIAESDIPAHLSLGDVALYPMRDSLLNRAKSPVKVLEQMLVGLPIVAHRVGQAADFIGDAGLLVEPADVRGMADAASALLLDPQKAKQLGEKARHRAWEHYNWEQLATQAEGAYRVALKGR